MRSRLDSGSMHWQGWGIYSCKLQHDTFSYAAILKLQLVAFTFEKQMFYRFLDSNNSFTKFTPCDVCNRWINVLWTAC